MSPQPASMKAVVSVKSETSYQSPPSSLSDISQHDHEDLRGRKQDRDRSTTARVEDDSGDEKETGPESENGKPRKRKRSRKGLEKNFPCPHQGCGKSYSRAEHLYRHQLNRKSLFSASVRDCQSYWNQQIRPKKSTSVISPDASDDSLDKICVRGTENATQHVVQISSGKKLVCKISIIVQLCLLVFIAKETKQAPTFDLGMAWMD